MKGRRWKSAANPAPVPQGWCSPTQGLQGIWGRGRAREVCWGLPGFLALVPAFPGAQPLIPGNDAPQGFLLAGFAGELLISSPLEQQGRRQICQQSPGMISHRGE